MFWSLAQYRSAIGHYCCAAKLKSKPKEKECGCKTLHEDEESDEGSFLQDDFDIPTEPMFDEMQSYIHSQFCEQVCYFAPYTLEDRCRFICTIWFLAISVSISSKEQVSRDEICK